MSKSLSVFCENFSALIFFVICFLVQHIVVGNAFSYTKAVNEIQYNFYPISDVVVEGNAHVPSEDIMRHIKTRPGDKFEYSILKEDLKNIFRMGYFNDVMVLSSDTNKGKTISFRVKEKEVVQKITITGAKNVDAHKIKKLITFSSNQIFNPIQLRKSEEKIRDLYKTKGFFDLVTTFNFVYPDEGLIELHFKIEEGKRFYVKEIAFSGNKTFNDEQLKTILSSSTKDHFSWLTNTGYLNANQLKTDVSRINNFYKYRGFLEVKVGHPQITFKGESLLSINFDISEGPRCKVGKVAITGDLIDLEEEYLKKIKIDDEIFLESIILRDDLDKLTDLFKAAGYGFVELEPRITASDELIDIEIYCTKGDLVNLNNVVIKGNNYTNDDVIRRLISIDEHDIFNFTLIDTSRESLENTGFFEWVKISPEFADDRHDVLDLNVEVMEKSTGAFNVGVEYNLNYGIMFLTCDIHQMNFLGKGYGVGANLSWGQFESNLHFFFKNPFSKKTISFGVTLEANALPLIYVGQNVWQ